MYAIRCLGESLLSDPACGIWDAIEEGGSKV